MLFRCMKASTSKATQNKKSKYTFKSPQKQCFSFPPDVISSMLNNPLSSNGLLKLYQTCKYFYSKKQILIMSDSKFDRSAFYYEEKNPKLLIGDFWDENYLDVQHLLWHIDKLEIMHYNDRYFEKPEYLEKNRIPKFYRCSIKELELYKTVLSVDDFLLITAEKQIQRFTIHRDSWISNSDYSKVDLAEIFKFEVMPKLKFLTCYRSATNCSNEVFEKLSKIQLQTKLSDFFLRFGNSIPENEFKGEYLFEFIKNNAEQKKTTAISFEAYNEKLQPFLHEIVERWENEILKLSE